MPLLIPKEIDDDEILVHFIFDRNFKNKIIAEEKLVAKDIFLPNKGGVSFQRNFYCQESKCKDFAKGVAVGKVYIGFIVFRKSHFEKVKQDYIQNDRNKFEADIFSTPLDENFEYLPKEVEVYMDAPGNPALRENESPNTAIRSFSRKLSKDCKLIIDSNSLSDSYDDVEFKKVV